jgi:peptide deformylase
MTKLKGKKKAKARKKKQQQSKMSAVAYKKKMLSKILKYNNENLSKKCSEVASGADVSKTISTMKKVLGCTDNGVGLAASQIGVLERIIVIRPDASKYDITAMINPKIVSQGDVKKYGIEGCLSYPKTFAPVERYAEIEVKYFDENWKEQTVSFKEGDIESIVVQHEIEHLEEGHCQIHDWWEDEEGKQKELQEIWDAKYAPQEEVAKSAYEVVESEDLQREKEEAETAAG